MRNVIKYRWVHIKSTHGISKLSRRGSKLPSARMRVGVLLHLLVIFIDGVQFYRQFHNIATLCYYLGFFFLVSYKAIKNIQYDECSAQNTQSKLKATCSVALKYLGHRNILELACTLAFLKQHNLRNYTCWYL